MLRQVQLDLRLFNVTMNRCDQLVCEEDTTVSHCNNECVWVGEQCVVASVRSAQSLTKRVESSLRANVADHGHTQYLIVEIFLKSVDHMCFLLHRKMNVISDTQINYTTIK